nr:immunoglobulin heavy chain junction region [Mus musculus]
CTITGTGYFDVW